jgi:uncharacterized protein (UPF0210 family)
MKIRTITTGISLQSTQEIDKVKPVAEFNQQSQAFFEQQGYEVQTTRITTNPWEEYLPISTPEAIKEIQALERLCDSLDISLGTLAISGMLTRVLKNVSVKICGYSGLMLPVCEDVGLASRANEQTYNITNLLLYSAVCGCGLDTVPLPGDITVDQISAILIDIATLAIKLNKPISARLFPIPNKKTGEMTKFNSPYLVDCQIFAVD